MRPLRAVLRNEAVRAALCWLGAQYIRAVHASGSWRVVGGEIPSRLWAEGRPFILAFWHGRLLMMPYCWDRRQPIRTLTSEHPDGRLIARTTAHFGIGTVTGSTRRGGVGALRALVRVLKSGVSVGMTPDGPLGPRMRAQGGIVALARLSGAPIVPVAYASDRRRVLPTWDRFVLALPFGRGVIVWGEPMSIADEDEALETARLKLEGALNRVTAEADRLCGCPPIEPAPAAGPGADARAPAPDDPLPEAAATAAARAGFQPAATPAPAGPRGGATMLALYRGATGLAAPLVPGWLALRRDRGKEDGTRLGERKGRPGRPRPPGPLVWMHAASVGESLSLLPLIERLLARAAEAHVLVTTGTVTSARLMAERLPVRAFHQYVPVDRLAYVRPFLDHWRPDLVVWAESEFWPNLLGEAAARGLPLALVQGRVSANSFSGWTRFRPLIAHLLAGFTLCLGQTEDDVERLGRLGARSPKCLGNLKFAAAPLPAPAEALARIQDEIGNRPRWLAASIHPGEDEVVARVHRELSDRHPGLLTVVVPRHPERGAEVAREVAAAGLNLARRSRGEPIEAATQVYVADTLGELGLFYRLVQVVFIGKSLVPLGGQNPLEAARLGCALIHGPHMANFADIARRFDDDGGAEQVADAAGLAAAVDKLLADDALRARRVEAARRIAAAEAHVLDKVMAALAPLIDAACGGGRVART